MPLLRYFLYVGGTLLGLLFLVNAEFPAQPFPDALTSASDLPPIRIQSERKLPERVVIDTSVALPMQASAKPVVAAQVQAIVPPVAAATPATAAMSAKARVREAFAQLPQADDAFEPKMSDMATVVLPDPKMYPTRPPVVRHKVAAKPRSARPYVVVAQQPHLGLFDIW